MSFVFISVPSSIDFVEFARRKLKDDVTRKTIETRVVIKGDLLTNEKEDMFMELEKEVSEEAFVKVRMDVRSFSSLSVASRHKDTVGAYVLEMDSGSNHDFGGDQSSQNSDSNAPQPGSMKHTVHTHSMATYRHRGQQTETPKETVPASVPAVFQGTMLTPVFFSGKMFTAGELDKLIQQTCSDYPTTVPVSFHGNMIASSDKQRGFSEIRDGQEVPVKFQGELRGVLKNGVGLPVALQGSMVNAKKRESNDKKRKL